jgi:uncharacterized protein (DUF736 family)
MTQIGSFVRNADGSYAGTIKTLAINAQARLVPSDPVAASEKSPDLRNMRRYIPSRGLKKWPMRGAAEQSVGNRQIVAAG